MAKRELSSTLKNLKFMQRAAKRQDPKPKEEDEEETPAPTVSFGGGPAAPRRRCIVITEGNPHPGALKGRMSFQSFNPSIDKLHEEAADIHQMQECVDHQNTRSTDRENGTPRNRSSRLSVSSSDNGSEADLKRKQPEAVEIPFQPQKPQTNSQGDDGGQTSSEKKRKGFHKPPQNREKLDWNVLRPPNPHQYRNGGEVKVLLRVWVL